MSSQVAPKYGSFGRRGLALTIDTLLIYVAQLSGSFFGGILAGMMAGTQASQSVVERMTGQGMVLGYVFWGFALWVLNFGVLQGVTGATIGKHIMRIRLVSRRDFGEPGVTRALIRSMAYTISSLPFYLGFVAYFWDKNRQCWHDLICDTFVVDADQMVEGGVKGDEVILALPDEPVAEVIFLDDRTRDDRAA